MGMNNKSYSIADPYRYFEEDTPALKNWLLAESKISKKFFDMCDERQYLKQSLMEYINFPKLSLPAKRGNHYYFTYNTGLQD
jgi:prolyl oligopeptidase